MKKLSLLSLLIVFSLCINAQTWNGIGVHVPTFRNGPVLIGTSEIPNSLDVGNEDLNNYKLFVCGGILADEWLVPNANWCDYVFASDYYLTPLAEVKTHIAEKGHLHKTPSAAEIEENGLEVYEITLNQQEKIEELFLHMIEMEERMNALEKENTKLKEEVARLKISNQ